VADLGHVTAKILENKEKYLGKKVAVTADHLTPNEIAATFTKGTLFTFNYYIQMNN
jgi:hypothetical protein